MTNMFEITTEEGKGNRQLRHEIRDLVAQTGNDDLDSQVSDLLAGRAGYSFAEQRERASAVVDLLALNANDENLDQALALAKELVALIDKRDAVANDPVTRTAAAITAAQVTLEKLTKVTAFAQERVFELTALLAQLKATDAGFLAENLPTDGEQTA